MVRSRHRKRLLSAGRDHLPQIWPLDPCSSAGAIAALWSGRGAERTSITSRAQPVFSRARLQCEAGQRGISSSRGSASVLASSSQRRPASEWTGKSSWTPISKRARQEYSRPVISRAGWTRTAATPFVLSTGSWRNVRVKQRPSTSSGDESNSPTFRFSGASTTDDIPINYVGHAEKWDELTVEGDIAGRDCLVRFRRAGRSLAVASIFRDVQSLEAEVSLERDATR